MRHGLGLLAAGLLAGAAMAQPASRADAVPRYEAWRWAAPAALPVPDTTRRPPADPWLGLDKAQHFGGSLLLTLSGQYVLVAKLDQREARAWPVAAGVTLGLGLAKEIADSRRARNPLFSWRDLTADALGVGLAVALIHL